MSLYFIFKSLQVHLYIACAKATEAIRLIPTFKVIAIKWKTFGNCPQINSADRKPANYRAYR
jgi:hypothetical protein